jgi:hypothetical protein
MNPDRSYLPFKGSEQAFVNLVSPVYRRYRCLPVHIKGYESGQATPDARGAVKMFDDVISKCNLIVKYQCTDGDSGHKQAHLRFFNE